MHELFIDCVQGHMEWVHELFIDCVQGHMEWVHDLFIDCVQGHMEWLHELRQFRCDFCDHVTRAVGQLREHVRCMHTHRDVKPYQCGYCEFRRVLFHTRLD